MEKLILFEKRVNRWIEAVVTLFFFCILCTTIILVIMRYGFNTSIVGGNEAMNYLFIYTTALGVAVSVSKNEHIKISFLVDQLRGRLRRMVHIVNYLLIGFINGVMIWYSIPWIKSAGLFQSPVLRLPNWMIQISVPLGSFLVILYCLNHVLLEILQWNQDPEG